MKRSLASLLAWGLLPLSAAAVQITPSAFDGSAIVESFEGLVVGPNVGQSVFANILEPGIVGPYTFSSGVTLVAPVPNPGTLNNGAFVHDFSLPAGATNNWGANGSVASALDVPFGTAYLAAFDNIHGGTVPTSITLDFGSNMLVVGAYVTGAAGATVSMSAYDASGGLLESAQVNTVPVSAWGTNFLGIGNAAGIRRVVFSGVDFGIDGLTFGASGTLPVPELSTSVLLVTGLIGLSLTGRRKRSLRLLPPGQS
jgi:hypothetical protein